MKKFIFSVLFVLALLVAVSPAFALQCKEGNYGSDECWTNVIIASNDTTVVIPGTVLVYDHRAVDATVDTADFTVRAQTVSTDSNRIAGVAQQTIATGDRGMVLVRGHGQIRYVAEGGTSTSVASGDRLYLSATDGAAGQNRPNDASASVDGSFARALEASTTGTTIDAYITVI